MPGYRRFVIGITHVECVGIGRQTEYEFIQSIRDRRPGDCRGPHATLKLWRHQIGLLDECFEIGTAPHDLLWQNFQADHPFEGFCVFRLCAAHWMDLSYLVGIRSRENGRVDWMALGSSLMHKACLGAGFDPKEIINMIHWQRVG